MDLAWNFANAALVSQSWKTYKKHNYVLINYW